MIQNHLVQTCPNLFFWLFNRGPVNVSFFLGRFRIITDSLGRNEYKRPVTLKNIRVCMKLFIDLGIISNRYDHDDTADF